MSNSRRKKERSNQFLENAKKLLAKKELMNKRVRNGENMGAVATELNLKIVNPL
jgi:hypothetical protein